MRALIAGDLHGNGSRGVALIREAASNGCEVILQCGDFGYWPASASGLQFLADLDRELQRADMTLYFADGNHEDHRSLNHDAVKPYSTFHSSRIKHVPRGAVLELGETRILFIGGAVSVDKELRTPGFDWFPEEMPSPTQIARARAAENIDMVISHDSPVADGLRGLPGVPEYLQVGSTAWRQELLAMLYLHKPRIWYCGHWHLRRSYQVEETKVRILGADQGGFSLQYELEEL